jgi:hypothetical protein
MRFALIITGCLLLIIFINGCYYDKGELLYPGAGGPCDTTVVAKFSTVVLPMMNLSCNSGGCHNTTSAAAGVILDTYSGVKVQAGNGRLIGSISHAGGYSAMPKGGAKFTTCNIAKIQQWITAGSLNN